MKRTLLFAFGFSCFSAAFSQTTTYNYTGGIQMYIVPQCVNSVSIQAAGAQGNPGAPGVNGGLGGSATGELPVSFGDTLFIYVGGQNSYNGGGLAGPGGPNISGNGGGASDVRFNDSLVGSRIIVAGGGGGGTGSPQGSCGNSGGGNGGDGGGTTGLTGGTGPGCGSSGTGGMGGSQSTGGAGGAGNFNCSSTAGAGNAGGLFIGGNGGAGIQGCGGFTGSGGGGGGGGYYGGASGGGGAGGGGGAWSGGGGGGGSSYLSPSLLASATTAGTRSGNGSVMITVSSSSSPSAPASITGSLSLCQGATSSYTASVSPGATTYTWTVPADYSIISGQGTNTVMIMGGTTSNTISVTAGNTCGTSTATTLAITINARPVVGAAAASGTICSGSGETLTATGAASYAWSSGGTAATEIVSPSATTTYSVVGTDVNNCSDTAFVTVTVNPSPVVTASASASVICAGSNDTLTAVGALNYAWSSGGMNAVEYIAPVSTTTYSVIGTDANGCSDTAMVTINVNALPTVVITGSGAVCAGSSATLAGSGAVSYQWSSGGNTSTEIVTPASSSTYTLTGTDVNGCTNTATATVTVNALPTVTGTSSSTTMCTADASATLTGTPAGGTWSGPGVTGSSFNPMSAGVGAQVVTYSYTDGQGCSASSAVTITVSACVGINEQQLSNDIAVFPNPNQGVFTLTLPAEGKLEIFNSVGQVIYTGKVFAGENKIALGTADSGIYFIRLTDGQNNVHQSRMTIQQ